MNLFSVSLAGNSGNDFRAMKKPDMTPFARMLSSIATVQQYFYDLQKRELTDFD